MFTARATMADASPVTQGTAVLDYLLRPAHLSAADVPGLLALMNALANSVRLNVQQVIVTSDLPATLGTVQSGWNAIAVPVLLITAQLLVPVWLLLFLAVRDAAEARGPEIALAKLRGYGPGRSIVFGLSEPALLLLVALPAGALAGWALTAALGRVLLRPGTPVGLPPLAWAAAAAATAGGLTAMLIAAWRTVRRPVVEQWRRAGRRAADRGWVLDAVLLTGAVAGLIDLVVGGQITSARRSVLGLLVPGLVGLAVAVVASRLLPVACRALFRPTSRDGGVGGLGGFLAVRHIVRRPGGVRTTMVLTTAFALAGFAVAAWSVDRGNNQLVAGAEVGARRADGQRPARARPGSGGGPGGPGGPNGRGRGPVHEPDRRYRRALAVGGAATAVRPGRLLEPQFRCRAAAVAGGGPRPARASPGHADRRRGTGHGAGTLAGPGPGGAGRRCRGAGGHGPHPRQSRPAPGPGHGHADRPAGRLSLHTP